MTEFIVRDGPEPKYEQFKLFIKEMIQRGEFDGASEFPTEREWASRCGISRFTVREALRALEKDGLLRRLQGKGTFVNPNPARAEAPGESSANHVGVLLPQAEYMGSVGIVRGIEDVCSEREYHAVLGNYGVAPEKERACMKGLVDRGAAGLIVFSSFNSYLNGYYQDLARLGIPFVLVDGPVMGVAADLVATDNFRGAYEGAKALVAAGCRAPAFLSGHQTAATSRERLAGCCRAFAEHGLSLPEDRIATGAFAREFGYQATNELLAAHKDADGLFVANESITPGVLKAIRELGLTDPERIRICTFDEPNYSLDYAFPMVLVRQPRYETGRRAAEILFDRMRQRAKAEAAPPPQTVLLAPEIVVPAEYRCGQDKVVAS